MEVLNLLVAPITEVIKCFSPSLERRIFYIIRFKRNVDSLKNQEVKLKELKIDVQRSVEAAHGNGEVIKAVVEGWLTRVDDFEREMTLLLLEIDEKKGCFQVGFSTCYDLRKRTKMNLDAINELLIDGEKFSTTVVSGPPPRPRGIQTMPILDFQAFESTQKAMDQIIKHFRDDEINRVGVYGMGGIGKTTLMKEITKIVIEDGIFSYVVMVTVTQTPVLKKIQGEIAANLGIHLLEEESEAIRARHLFSRLEQEDDILLIFDDTWGRLDLVDVGIPCGDDHKNCKVVIVSRNEDVCWNMMDTDATVQLDVLSYEDSWLLFQKNAGYLSPSLGTLPRDVANECGGLPIALVTLGRALRNGSPAAWRNASRQLKKSMMADIRDMQKVVSTCIRLSYDFIESKRIKLCFLFCCLFPEDYRITLQKLMHYGMGERIFGEFNTLEEATDTIQVMVENLVSSSLLLRVNDYEGEEYVVVMHDVVRDVGITIASEEENGFLIRAGIGLEEWPEMEKLEECKRMSIMGNKINMLPDQLPCPKLSTLLLSDNIYLEEVPERSFERMKALTTLDLSGNPIKSLPSSFLCLTNLRSLHLNFCHITDASLLGNLKKLEIISLRNCFLKSLPKEIGELANLKLLDLSQNGLETIPPNLLSRLSRLEELYMAGNVIEWEIEGVGDGSKASLSEVASLSMLTVLHLTAADVKCFSRCNSTNAENLKKFEICVGSTNLYSNNKDKRNMCIEINVSEPISAWIKALFRRTEDLTLTNCNDFDENTMQLDVECFKCLEVLKVIQCHDMKCLMSLEPNNILVCLQSLEELIVIDCGSLMDMFNLVKLEQRHAKALKLRKLILERLPDLSTIWRVIVPSMLQIFQQLKELTISYCNDMVQIISVEEEKSTSTRLRKSYSGNFSMVPTPIFQNLRILNIYCCGSLKHVLPMELAQSLQQLEQIFISICDEMEEIIAVKDAETMGKVVLPRLKSLGLHKLPQLSSPCQGVLLLECPSLEEIDISDCPNLKGLSLCMDNVTKLKKIHAEEKWLEGLEYDEPVKNRLYPLLEKPSAAPSRIHLPAASSTIEKMLANLPSIVAGVWSENSRLQLEAITWSQNLFSIQSNILEEKVIQSGIVPRFVEFLMRDDFPQLQYEAVSALPNIVAGSPENTMVVIDHGAVPIFIKLLNSPSDKVRIRAVWALGNVAFDSPKCRDVVLGHGALIPLLELLNEHTKLPMLRRAIWTLSAFCNGNPQLPFEHRKSTLKTLECLIHSNDQKVLIYTCLALSHLSEGANDKIQATIEAGVCPRLIELLLHPSPSVLIHALQTIAHISMGDDVQTQYIIDHQALPCLLNLLLSHNHKHRNIVKIDACATIANITAKSKDQIQAVIEADIIGPLLHLLQTANFDIKKHAARAISNATSSGTHDQIKFLVSQGCIKPLCDLLVCTDLRIVIFCLNGLKNILIDEAESNNTRGVVNLFAQLIDDAKGFEKIKNLLNYDNTEIKETALEINKLRDFGLWMRMMTTVSHYPLGDVAAAEPELLVNSTSAECLPISESMEQSSGQPKKPEH